MADSPYPKQLVASTNGMIIWEDKLDTSSQMITTNALQYNLVPNKKTVLITFFGTTTILNLPNITTNIGIVMLLYNAGSGDVVITGNPTNENSVIDGGMEMASTVLTSGSPMTIFSMLVGNTPKWIIKP